MQTEQLMGEHDVLEQLSLTPIRFPTNERNPVDLIDFTMVQLAQLETPEELAHALIEFLEPKTLEFVDAHSDEFYVLGMIWLNSLKRIIESHQPHDFAYELLALPLLFREWNWQYNMDDEWRTLYEQQKADFFALGDDVEAHVHASLVLFCIEAIFTEDTHAPFNAMTTRLINKLSQSQYADALISLGMILGRNGWTSGY